jgi:hypothetical protein
MEQPVGPQRRKRPRVEVITCRLPAAGCKCCTRTTAADGPGGAWDRLPPPPPPPYPFRTRMYDPALCCTLHMPASSFSPSSATSTTTPLPFLFLSHSVDDDSDPCEVVVLAPTPAARAQVVPAKSATPPPAAPPPPPPPPPPQQVIVVKKVLPECAICMDDVKEASATNWYGAGCCCLGCFPWCVHVCACV